MLNITTTTVKKEGVLIIEDVEYRVICNTVNDIITSVSCSIVRNMDGVLTEVGNITKEKGQINSFIRENENNIEHFTRFNEVVLELESVTEIVSNE